MKKLKTLATLNFLPNQKAKIFSGQIPKEAKNPILIIQCTELSAPTNEKVFFCSATQNSKVVLSKCPIANQNRGIIPIQDYLKNYFTSIGASLQIFARFYKQIKMPLYEGNTQIRGTIYTKELTGNSQIDVILSYEL
jgi:hypothetical protein